MRVTTVLLFVSALWATASPAAAQFRRTDRDRQDVARAQGVAVGQLPPANRCRVWYDNRSAGRQPAATSCPQAEAIASRDRNARVIYGEDVYSDSRGWGSNDRAVRRDGRVRDPRIDGGILEPYGQGPYGRDPYGRDPYGRDTRDTYGRQSIAFENGYRDGMTKGRDDGEDDDRYDVNRHGWYRSATRGYDDDEHGSRSAYQARYRQGFEEGYSAGYRVYARRER